MARNQDNAEVNLDAFPTPPLFTGLHTGGDIEAFKQRRLAIMAKFNGPIILMAPKTGPNRDYPWAHCYAPVYQDSYILYLTGINQIGILILLDPIHRTQHIFLPTYNPEHGFWEGPRFCFNCAKSHAFLTALGFSAIHPINQFKSIIQQIGPHVTWHFNLDQHKKSTGYSDVRSLKLSINRLFKQSVTWRNIASETWKQRLSHDKIDIESIKIGIQKTQDAFTSTLSLPFNDETTLSGQLVGELLKKTPFGLAFSPIVASNYRAGILHYSNNSAQIAPSDMVLLDFGLRWRSMCTDLSRTIPAKGKYTELQRYLMNMVLETQSATIEKIRVGITFDELNAFAWHTLEKRIEQFMVKGGRIHRSYTHQPHHIGHFLGIQVHDGDANRMYKNMPLPNNAIITIEPGLYGEFEWKGDRYRGGIRIEDNLLVQKNGVVNLTKAIPKSCQDIEKLMANHTL